MQLVSRQILTDLLRGGGNVTADGKTTAANEAEGTVSKASLLDYDEFVEVHHKHLKHFYSVEAAYDAVRNKYLRHKCPPIEYIAEGSSRAAYACSGGLCLKIAMTDSGIRQNKLELKNTTYADYSCFAAVHSYDETKYASLLTECCCTVADADFEEAFGLKGGVMKMMLQLENLRDCDFDFAYALKEIVPESDAYKFLKNVKDGKGA